MLDLIGKKVEVGTPETVYHGTLIEVNDDEVYIESEMGWVMIPIDRVTYLREYEEA